MFTRQSSTDTLTRHAGVLQVQRREAQKRLVLLQVPEGSQRGREAVTCRHGCQDEVKGWTPWGCPCSCLRVAGEWVAKDGSGHRVELGRLA